MSFVQTPLAGKVCIVTGATRGIGKGVALQLAEKGAKVYITGRTLDTQKQSKVVGSLRETAEEIKARGGTCIPVQCDHSKDVEIERLFEQVKQENDGQLDILVNNAYSGAGVIMANIGKKFWELPATFWDDINGVGLRNHYLCAVYASRIMVPRKSGLIVNISSAGGLRYVFNAAYGIGKEACDRMAADCAYELRKDNVAFVSLWPGFVGTEGAMSYLRCQVEKQKAEGKDPVSLRKMEKVLENFEKGETTEFVGQCVAAIAADADIMKMSGKILLTCDLARRYGLKDADGHKPSDFTKVKYILQYLGFNWTACLFPEFVRIPKWMYALGGYKFF